MSQSIKSKLFQESVVKMINDASIVLPGINDPVKNKKGQLRHRKLTIKDLDKIQSFRMSDK